MHRPLRLLAAAAIAALAGPALATNGMRMIGFSPVQNSMGGVGVGATLDGGAALTNPAGMTELGRRLDLSLTWFQPSVDYKATGAAPGFVAQDGVKLTSDRGGSPIPNVGFILPLGSGFTAGLGAFGVGGMGVDYKSNLYGGRTLTSYQNLRLAPAVAYKLNDAFSVGLTANLSWAQMKFDVASGFGQVPHDTSNAFGAGATIGLKVTPVKDLAIGLAYETRTDFSDFKFTIPAHNAMTPTGPVPVPGGTDALSFDQPAVASAGLAYRVAPPLLLAFDVEWINWSDVMGNNKPAYTNNTQLTGAMPFNMGWSDQVVFKIGAEVEAAHGVKVRAGFDYGKNPLKASRAFENIAFPAVAESHITLGLGFAFNDQLALNVGGMYAPNVKISGANAQEQGIASYETSMSQYSLDAGLAWQF
jgi:long-chain fatty acid transport protein